MTLAKTARKNAPRKNARKNNSGITTPVVEQNNDFITIGAPIVTPEIAGKPKTTFHEVIIYNAPIEGVLVDNENLNDAVDNEPLTPEQAFEAYRATYARTTRVFAPNTAPKAGSKTEIIFNLCVDYTLAGKFTGDKTLDKKLFMGYAHAQGVDICDTSLSAGFYQWVRSLRPMPIN